MKHLLFSIAASIFALHSSLEAAEPSLIDGRPAPDYSIIAQLPPNKRAGAGAVVDNYCNRLRLSMDSKVTGFDAKLYAMESP